MKILLVSLYSDIASLGLRIIAAAARDAGHDVCMVFLPHTPAEENRVTDSEHRYPEDVLHRLIEIAADCRLIGIGLMSNYLARARIISTALTHAVDAPLVWGGIHPTIRPEDAVGFADYCIVGEGEYAFIDLANAVSSGHPVQNIPNLFDCAVPSQPPVPPRPLIQDLNTLPFPDYGPENHHIWDRESGGLVPMTMELLRKHLALGPISRIKNLVTYQTLATRGCPHRCAYCCNDVLQALYSGQKHLRRRSHDNVIEELRQVQEKYPFIQGIGFSDDSFFAARDTEIQAFAGRYQAEIGLPFFCLGSPVTITEPKLVSLLDAGMYGLQMGVQTGSTRMQKVYNRTISNEKVLETVNLLHTYTSRMVPPSYDFIIDSPWESEADLIETLQLVRRFPRPYRLQLFSLVLFPGTALYYRALNEQIIDGMDDALLAREYHSRRSSYTNIILGMYRYPLPKKLLDFLSHPRMVRILNRSWLNRVYSTVYRLGSLINRKLLKNR